MPYVGALLKGESGCFIAASDYMKVLPQGIAGWVPGPFCSLGTDGYGLSESRSALRDYFEVSAEHIVIAALSTLARHGHIDTQEAVSALQDFKIDPNKPDPSCVSECASLIWFVKLLGIEPTTFRIAKAGICKIGLYIIR